MIRQNLPKKCFATRIENKHGGGVPDCHMVWDGLPFWCELKVSKGNAVKSRPIKLHGIWLIGQEVGQIFS